MLALDTLFDLSLFLTPDDRYVVRHYNAYCEAEQALSEGDEEKAARLYPFNDAREEDDYLCMVASLPGILAQRALPDWLTEWWKEVTTEYEEPF